MAALGLRFCARAFSSCGKWGPLFIAVHGPLIIAASLVAEHRLQTRSVIVAHGPSRSTTCGIFPDQGSNPCPPHWQADSQPLRHQGSLIICHFCMQFFILFLKVRSTLILYFLGLMILWKMIKKRKNLIV